MTQGSPSMPLSVALLEMNVNEDSAGGHFLVCIISGEAGPTTLK